MDTQMHWFEVWVRAALSAPRAQPAGGLARRERADIIAQHAVLIGVTAAVGIGLVLTFMTGLGAVFTRSLAKFAGLVP